MRYMFLLYGDESRWTEPRSPEWRQVMKEYEVFAAELHSRGLNHPPREQGPVLGDPLQPTDTATTVRVRDGQVLVSDGPFAEAKEQLGGYYIINCTDLDDALALAAMIPASRGGSVEVRPILELMQD